jgi:hypothetical protein
MTNHLRTGLIVRVTFGVLAFAAGSSGMLRAAERVAPPRLTTARAEAFTDSEREALVSWVMTLPEARAALAGHRTRLLRVWSDVAKGNEGAYRRASLIFRDYDAGTAREITVNLSTGGIETRELVGVQPSREEIEEGMSIIRSDPALAGFVANPKLELLGGFHNRSRRADDPCAREICLDFAFMRPNYEGPARYVIVNLTRRVVANRDFRARPGEAIPRMTEKVAP